MKRLKPNWQNVAHDATGYLTELGWMILYTIALFLLTWLISVFPW